MRTTFYAIGHVPLDVWEHVALRVNICRYEYICNTLINSKSSNIYRISRLLRASLNREREREDRKEFADLSPAPMSKSRPRDQQSRFGSLFFMAVCSPRRDRSGERTNVERSIDWLRDFRDEHTRTIARCACSLYNVHNVSVSVPAYLYLSISHTCILALCRYEIKIHERHVDPGQSAPGTSTLELRGIAERKSDLDRYIGLARRIENSMHDCNHEEIPGTVVDK